MELPPLIELNKQQQKLFRAVTPRVALPNIDCDEPMRALAAERQRLIPRERHPSVTDFTLGSEMKRLDRRVELFIPIAHAALIHELADLLEHPQKLNDTDL